MPLTLSAKTFGNSAPSVWKPLCYYTVDLLRLLSSFKRILKTELFDITYSEREYCAYSFHQDAPLIRLRHTALYKFDLIDSDWLILGIHSISALQEAQGIAVLSHACTRTEMRFSWVAREISPTFMLFLHRSRLQSSGTHFHQTSAHRTTVANCSDLSWKPRKAYTAWFLWEHCWRV